MDGRSAAAELRALHRRRRGAVLVAEINAALGEIVGRHLDRDAVAGKDADAVLLHPAGGIGQSFVAVVEPYTKPRIGQELKHRALEFDQFFLCQKPFSSLLSPKRGTPKRPPKP